MQAQDRKKRVCIVPVCHGERFDLVHKFPSDNKRAEIWRKILDIPQLYTLTLDQIRKRYFVCSRHFKITDYKNIESRGLNKTAEPSKNLRVLDDYDTIDITAPREQIQLIVDEEVSEPMRIIPDHNNQARNNLVSCVLLDPIGPKNEDTLKRRLQIIKGYGTKPKRAMIKKPVERVNQNIVATLSPPVNLKDIEGQLVFHIDQVETCDNDAKKIFLESTDNSRECEKDDVELIDDPEYVQFVEPEEVEEILPDEEISFVDIDDQEKEDVEENTEVVDIFTHGENNNKEDEDDDAISDILSIIHPDYATPLKFHHFWLRDHCRCEICYSAETFQRKFNIMDIPIDIKVRECTIEGKDLSIEWSDDHKSTYDLDFLFRAKYENYRKQLIDNDPTVLWDKNVINDADYARVDFSDYLANGEISKSVVRSLVKYGVAFIEKVPPNVQSTEIAIRNLFPIHRTFFGEMFTVLTDFKEFQDSAYSKEFLPAHTDNTYFPEASGLQILHVTQHNGTGGETLLVDGFKAATELKRKYPDAFDRLLYTNIPAEYLEEGQSHYDCSPLIKQNSITDELEQIRFNLYDRAPLHSIPHNQIMQYYKDFRLLANEIQSPQNEWWFKLNPGTVMIFNNWRVLHGRAQYTGKRSLAGSYVSRTDFMSKARCLGIIE